MSDLIMKQVEGIKAETDPDKKKEKVAILKATLVELELEELVDQIKADEL